MRLRIPVLVLIVTGPFSGCDGSPSRETTVLKGPHLGTTLQLPDKKGYVELVNEPEVKDRRSNQPTAIVAYYLQPDAKSALTPAPSDVRFSIDSGGGRDSRSQRGGSQILPLSAEPKSDDPAAGARFASKPGPYQLSNLRGTLNAKIDGQEVSIIFQGAR